MSDMAYCRHSENFCVYCFSGADHPADEMEDYENELRDSFATADDLAIAETGRIDPSEQEMAFWNAFKYPESYR